MRHYHEQGAALCKPFVRQYAPFACGINTAQTKGRPCPGLAYMILHEPPSDCNPFCRFFARFDAFRGHFMQFFTAQGTKPRKKNGIELLFFLFTPARAGSLCRPGHEKACARLTPVDTRTQDKTWPPSQPPRRTGGSTSRWRPRRAGPAAAARRPRAGRLFWPRWQQCPRTGPL